MFDAFFLQGIKNILVVVAAMQMVYVARAEEARLAKKGYK